MNHQEDKLITFKIFVFKNQKPTEIRKFSLKSTDLSFENMEENLLAIFSHLKKMKYTLLWKDHEEDFITLSTAKEFSTFERHITKSETNDETKLFINFEDELFAASQNFEQSRSGVNFSCDACHKNLTLMCLDCTATKNLPQEQKILNITNKTPVELSHSNENCKTKPATTSTGSSGNNLTQKGLSTQSAFNSIPSSAPSTFPAAPAYQFGSSFGGSHNFK